MATSHYMLTNSVQNNFYVG